MSLAGAAIGFMPRPPILSGWVTKRQLAAAILLGAGTALVYPTLIAAVSDASQPRDRARVIGVYRFWRDFGFVLGIFLIRQFALSIPDDLLDAADLARALRLVGEEAIQLRRLVELGAGGLIAFVAGGILLFDEEVPGFGVPLPLGPSYPTAPLHRLPARQRRVLVPLVTSNSAVRCSRTSLSHSTRETAKAMMSSGPSPWVTATAWTRWTASVTPPRRTDTLIGSMRWSLKAN